MLCMSELRQVRFRCGHSAYCIKCFDDIKQKAIDAKAIVADTSRTPQEREAAEKKAVIQCPTCREPIGEELAEKGDKVGNAPTPVMQPKGGCRGGRGGRGASGRGLAGSTAGRSGREDVKERRGFAARPIWEAGFVCVA